MNARTNTWSQAKRIRRVWDSVHAGGYAIEESPQGLVVTLSDSREASRPMCFLLPRRRDYEQRASLLHRSLLGALRRTILATRGTRRIAGREAWQLRRWLVRWAPKRSSRTVPHPAAPPRAKVSTRSDRKSPRPKNAGYIAERSRRGWVLRVSTSASSNSRGIYLVPFMAMSNRDRDWDGRWLLNGLACVLGELGAQRVDESEAAALPE
jgi:hypothetical protein